MGKRLVASSGASGVGVTVFDTTGRRGPDQVDDNGRRARWSPDGRFIAWTENNMLVVSRSDGSRPATTQIHEDGDYRFFSGPRWRPLP